MGYACYPMKTLRMSSLWNTGSAHKKCSGGSPKDYPTDLVGVDSGRDWAYNRFGSDLVVLRKYTKASHAIWCRTAKKVYIPCSKKPVYLYFMCEHQTISDMPAQGAMIREGAKMWREAACGNATGNHLHISFGYSSSVRSIGTGWTRNSKGAWVLRINGVKNIKIQDALYLDKEFTSVKDSRVKFKSKPNISANYKVKTNGSNLLIRDKDKKIIGRLANGTRIHVDDYGKDRCHIDSPSSGYVATKYITKL